MSRKKIINLAFIGTGNWARRHHFPSLAAIQAMENDAYTLNLGGITSLDLNVAQDVADQYGFEKVYSDIDALLADPDVNAIAIAVTPEAAKLVITQAVQKKVPIFSEKPPGISTADAQFLSETVTVPNVVAFNRRFIPLNQTFRNIVADMTDITFIEGSFYRHERLDDTFMVGTGIHWINFVEFLLGPITGVTTKRWQNPQNDSWLRTGTITFGNGVSGLLKFFPCTGSDFERVEIHSNAQSAYLEGPSSTVPGRIIIERGAEKRVIEQAEPLLPEDIRIGIVGEYQAFFDLITKGTASPSTFQNAVNSMRVAEAMENGLDF